jgi:hypothetical protein
VPPHPDLASAGPLLLLRHHEAFLAEFRRFGAEGAARRLGPGDLETLQGALAFLEHEVLPFARAEERTLAGGSPQAESVALEHAFLAQEVEALGRELRALRTLKMHGTRASSGTIPGSPGPRSTSPLRSRALLRVVHRIEAILELHTAGWSDRGEG